MNLIKRVIQGDEAAAVEFYNLYSDKVYRSVVHKVPNPEDAQDLTQQVFLDALDSLHKLSDHKKVLPWLYTIGHNRLVDFYRKRKIKTILLSQLPFLQIAAAKIHEPEFVYEKNKIRDRIEESFRNLSPEYRNILQLHYEKGLSIKSIAPALNLSPKATESLLYRARQKFKGEYERE